MREALRAWLADQGYEIGVATDGFDGRLHSRRVDIAAGLDPDKELLVLLHEGAHVLLGHSERDYRHSFTPFTIADREASAEEVALLAAEILSKDLRGVSGDYLATLGPYRLDPRVELVADSLAACVISYKYRR